MPAAPLPEPCWMPGRREGDCGLLRSAGPTAFHPLQARGFNLITCFIWANLFFNQSCSARRKEATAGSFAPSCSKGEVNGSYPRWRCLQGCGPGSPFAGGCWPAARVGFNHLFPQHRATSPQFRHRTAWSLPEEVFDTRCLVRTGEVLAAQGAAWGRQSCRQGSGYSCQVVPGVSVRSQGIIRVYRAPKTTKKSENKSPRFCCPDGLAQLPVAAAVRVMGQGCPQCPMHTRAGAQRS